MTSNDRVMSPGDHHGTVMTSSPSADAGGTAWLSRAGAVVRTERGLFLLALGAVGFHIADDNFLQPARGTSAGDHLASGLVPLAVLALLGVVYPRIRAGARAGVAMTAGSLAIVIGVPGIYYLSKGSASGDHYSAPLALLAGVLLLALGPVTMWRSRRRGGSRRRRYLLRTLTTLVWLALGVVVLQFIVFPVGLAYVYTHTGAAVTTPPSLGVRYEEVTVTTSDSLDLTAFYVPSRNRAAVVLFPGRSHTDEARRLIRHGYGVLLLDPRGQGGSDGDIVRWAGDRDLLAAAEYLQGRPDVDPTRIGAIGYSVGGESLLEAAARSTAFAAVVSEGAGERFGEQDQNGVWPMMAVLTAATTVFSNHGPPPPIVDRIGRISPRPVFLVYADPGMGGESTRQPAYYAAAGEPKAIWKVPGARHTGGFEAQPAEYERRLLAFFDRSLLDG
jgi:uncharacterized protein